MVFKEEKMFKKTTFLVYAYLGDTVREGLFKNNIGQVRIGCEFFTYQIDQEAGWFLVGRTDSEEDFQLFRQRFGAVKIVKASSQIISEEKRVIKLDDWAPYGVSATSNFRLP